MEKGSGERPRERRERKRPSPVALAFEAEIKRTALETETEVSEVVLRLGRMAGVSVRQIYNYRTGTTDIPATMIPVFCRKFGSNALAMAIVTMCNKTRFEVGDGFDLTTFASRSVRETLRGHEEFIEAFDDGRIDGHELARLSLSTAKIVRNAHRLLEIARHKYHRRRAA